MAGYHADGALGLDPLDKIYQTVSNAKAADRGNLLETQGRAAKAVLF